MLRLQQLLAKELAGRAAPKSPKRKSIFDQEEEEEQADDTDEFEARGVMLVPLLVPVQQLAVVLVQKVSAAHRCGGGVQ